MKPHSIALDNNLLRGMFSRGGERILHSFLRTRTLFRDCFSDPNSLLVFTPFGLLELIGLVPPAVPSAPLDNDLVRDLARCKADRERAELSYRIADEILNRAREFFANSEAVSHQAMVQLAGRQQSYVEPACRPLFDQCLPLDKMHAHVFEKTVHEHLSWDHLFERTFPKAIDGQMTSFLLGSMLVDGGLISGVSRFRLAKRFWDESHDKMLRQDPALAARGTSFARSMKLKSRRDFLDCDLIHLSCFGVRRDD